MTIEKAIKLLNLSIRTIPMTEEENDLLLELVRKWLIQHGEAWVRNNPLLECEWQQQRAELSRESATMPLRQ